MSKPSRAVVPVLGRRVLQLRTKRGWSATDLALEVSRHGVSVDKSKVLHVERGTSRGGLTGPSLKAFALALGTTSDYLLGLSNDPDPRS
jgi:transcriptional regulator with XRE-family HTH domain